MNYQLPQEAKFVLKTLKDAGFEAFAVGGCVRDLLLKQPTKDWDFTTNAKPEEIIKLFPDSYYDNKFGTVGVKIESGIKEEISIIFEITTYRSEYGYSDHRHPDKIIWGKTLGEDLQRRDFTINAMAFDGKEIIDYFNGREDLKMKIIKSVGDPNVRFKEDALRMMRAVRIATELGFLIEEETLAAITVNVLLLNKIAWERIRDEFLKILSSNYPSDGIKLLRNTGILSIVLPELESAFGVGQISPKRHHTLDVGTHLVQSLAHAPSKDPIVRLATLLHDIGKPITRKETADGVVTFYNHEIIGASLAKKICQRLRFSNKDTEKVYRLVRFHQFTVDERQTDSGIRRFIRNTGAENLDDMLALGTGDRLGGGARETSWRLELYKKRLEEVQKQPFTVADLKVDGYDVMKIYSISPGPLVGAVLDMVFNDVVEGKLPNEREVLLKRVEDLKKIGKPSL